MSVTSGSDDNQPVSETDGQEADRQDDALKHQLRKDVASWSAARSEGLTRSTVEFGVPEVRPSALQPATPARIPATRVRRPKSVLPQVDKQAPVQKQPFGMSYDGVTQADYITYMIARGAR